MDAADNFELPKAHSLSTTLSIHNAFRAHMSRTGLACAVCDEVQFLKGEDDRSVFGPDGQARWHQLSGAELLAKRDQLSLKAGALPLPAAVVEHYQLHPEVGSRAHASLASRFDVCVCVCVSWLDCCFLAVV
jgi:hypothetical protein